MAVRGRMNERTRGSDHRHGVGAGSSIAEICRSVAALPASHGTAPMTSAPRGRLMVEHFRGGSTKSQTRVTDVVAIAIPVRDQDAALAFYTGVLGCDVIADDVVGPGFRWLEVRPVGSTVGITLIAPEVDVPVGVDTGIRLSVEDAAAAHEALRASGAEVG